MFIRPSITNLIRKIKMAKKSPGSVIKWLSDMVKLITNHGFFKIVEAIILLGFALTIITVTTHPEIIITKFEEYVEKVNEEKKEFRKQNDPIIRTELHDLVWELDATRASVFEFHNGKENPSGLGFYYADMNYEIVKGNVYISDQYQNINLSLLNLPNYLYENGYWYGSVESLKVIDPKLGSMIEKNGTNWIALLLLESSVELGILEISFIEEPENKQDIGRELRKVGATVAAKLDFELRDK